MRGQVVNWLLPERTISAKMIRIFKAKDQSHTHHRESTYQSSSNMMSKYNRGQSYGSSGRDICYGVRSSGGCSSSSCNHLDSHYHSNNRPSAYCTKDKHRNARDPCNAHRAKSDHQKYEDKKLNRNNNKNENKRHDHKYGNTRHNNKDTGKRHNNEDQHEYAERYHAFKELKDNKDDNPVVKFKDISCKCHLLEQQQEVYKQTSP